METKDIILQDLLLGEEAFRYQMLGRLQTDCEYYLSFRERTPNVLWAKDEKRHIKYMKALYKSFSVKPEWITMEDIKNYEKLMVK